MGWFDDKDDHYNQYQNAMDTGNHASLGHEVLAGGAAFAAMKMFEDHQRKEGKPVKHQFAKEALAGLVGAEIDRFAETTGADWVDKEKAKRQAKEHAYGMYDEHYGSQEDYNPNQQGPPPGISGNW